MLPNGSGGEGILSRFDNLRLNSTALIELSLSFLLRHASSQDVIRLMENLNFQLPQIHDFVCDYKETYHDLFSDKYLLLHRCATVCEAKSELHVLFSMEITFRQSSFEFYSSKSSTSLRQEGKSFM